MSELLLRPATELAGLVNAGELSPEELVEASLRRIDELQPRINAFTYVAHESALAQARAIEPGDPRRGHWILHGGPFSGSPSRQGPTSPRGTLRDISAYLRIVQAPQGRSSIWILSLL